MPLFTHETAVIAGRNGALARWTKPKPEPEPLPPEPIAEATPPLADDYQAKRLVRVRGQLDTLDARLEAELRAAKPDSRAIREITEAQNRLSEQERILAGRPLPGSRKPAPDRAQRQAPTVTSFVVDDAPQ